MPYGVGGGLFSVALSVEDQRVTANPRLAVSQYPALWSPDFPPAWIFKVLTSDHPSCAGASIAQKPAKAWFVFELVGARQKEDKTRVITETIL